MLHELNPTLVKPFIGAKDNGRLGTALLQQYIHVQAIERAVAEEGWKVVLMLRLSPAFPFTAVNYATGLTCISFREFMVASAVGLIPGRHRPPRLVTVVSNAALV